MSRINIDSPKITLRLDPRHKAKASRIAAARGLSVGQLIEELINSTEEYPPAPAAADLRAMIREEIALSLKKPAKTPAKKR